MISPWFCPLAALSPAGLRVEDVLAEVNDLLQAPNPDRVTAAGEDPPRQLGWAG
jgi:hypothetical protein